MAYLRKPTNVMAPVDPQSTIVVTPDWIPTRSESVAVVIPNLYTWECMSMSPGVTIFPRASNT